MPRKKLLLSLLVLICICCAFWVRYTHEKVSFLQICPAIEGITLDGYLYWDGMEEPAPALEVSEERLREILRQAQVKHGKETVALDPVSIELRAGMSGTCYVITIGCEGNISCGRIGDLEGTTTFWKDPNAELFQTLYKIHAAHGGKTVAYRGSYLDFSSLDLSAVQSFQMRNMHNGQDSFIVDPEAVRKVLSFLSGITGINPESGKGYYEGTYSLQLYENVSAAGAVLAEEKPVFSIGFGDSNAFFYGEGSDGYPIRYELSGKTIEEITDFLSQFDTSLNP